jgi:hypothetical protein
MRECSVGLEEGVVRLFSKYLVLHVDAFNSFLNFQARFFSPDFSGRRLSDLT